MFVCCLEQIASGGLLLSALMLSRPSFYDGARPNPETERRAPEMGQSRQARLGCKRKSSGSIMAPIAADSQVCCSLWSVLLLVSTFWPKPDVPCAEQQVPLQFLVPAVPPWCSEWVGFETPINKLGTQFALCTGTKRLDRITDRTSE